MGILSLLLFSTVFSSLHDFASAISTLKATKNDQTACEMCYSCDNPCQPLVSPPPPSPPPLVTSAPPPFPPPVTGCNSPQPPMPYPPPPPAVPELNCPPPPPPAVPELNCPPPPSTGGGEGDYYFSPPHPTEPTYFPPLYGGGGAYNPPGNVPYSCSNPTYPYLPISYFCPPPPGIPNSHSAKLNSLIPASLVVLFFLFFIS